MHPEHVLQLVDTLAWPVTVLIALFVLRKPIRNALRLIHRIRYKDFDVEFGKELDQAEQDIGFASEDQESAFPEDEVAAKLIEVSPGAAVIESWKRLERTAREKVRDLIPADDTFANPLERPMDYLDLRGALIPPVANTVRNLRMLRNEAAHASGEQISKLDAIRYIQLAARIRRHIEAIDELPRAKLTALTFLVLQLNSAIDSRRHDDVTISDVYSWIENREVIPKLSEHIGDDIDVSLYGPDGPYPNFVEFYHDRLHALWGGYEGNHRRKWGVENSGLCLLLAWTNELIQQGSGWYPDDNEG